MFEPGPEHKFSFGLWTVSNRGRDPFGDAVRPPCPRGRGEAPGESRGLGSNLHDNDLVPIDATLVQRDQIVAEFRKACADHGIVVPMATVNLFFDPVFRDGAFTSNDAVSAPTLCKRPCGRWTLGRNSGRNFRPLGRQGRNRDGRVPEA